MSIPFTNITMFFFKYDNVFSVFSIVFSNITMFFLYSTMFYLTKKNPNLILKFEMLVWYRRRHQTKGKYLHFLPTIIIAHHPYLHLQVRKNKETTTHFKSAHAKQSTTPPPSTSVTATSEKRRESVTASISPTSKILAKRSMKTKGTKQIVCLEVCPVHKSFLHIHVHFVQIFLMFVVMCFVRPVCQTEKNVCSDW